MKVKREQIISTIKNKIFGTSKPSVIDEIRGELCVVGKFTIIEFNNISMGILAVEDLQDAELYWIIEAASKYMSTIKEVDYYFEQPEIERYKHYYRENNDEITYPIVFSNVVKLAENQYAFPYTLREIAKLKYNHIVEARPELQRESKIDKYGKIKIYTNPRRIRQIKELYENKEYAYNGIRFNLMDNGKAEFDYDEVSRELIVRGGNIIIPDGNHRALATELVDLNKSCADDSFIIFFTFFNNQRVKQTISQEWNIQPVNRSHVASMKSSNSNNIVDAIRRNPNSDPIYAGKIVTTGKEIQSGDGFILYSILSKAIDQCYDTDSLETQDERAEITDWISTYLNRLTAVLLNDFKNYQTVKKTRWSVDPYAFAGYILLSKYLKGRENWRNELTKIINSIDFSIEKSPLLNKTVKSNEKNMKNFFEEAVQNAEIVQHGL